MYIERMSKSSTNAFKNRGFKNEKKLIQKHRGSYKQYKGNARDFMKLFLRDITNQRSGFLHKIHKRRKIIKLYFLFNLKS